MKRNTMTDEQFVQEYTKAIRRKLTLRQFAESLGVSYIRIMQRKKRIADLTGKKLPPLTRPTKVVDVEKLTQLISSIHAPEPAPTPAPTKRKKPKHVKV